MRHENLPPVVSLLLKGHARCEIGWVNRMPCPPYEWCTVTALGCNNDDAKSEDIKSALRFLERAIGLELFCLPLWNDEPGRTKAEVLAAYVRAIELALAGARVCAS